MITDFKCKKSCYEKDGDPVFHMLIGERKGRNWLKLQQGRFRLEIRKKFQVRMSTETRNWKFQDYTRILLH